MKFASTAAAATILAGAASAQVSSPLTLLQYASQLLTPDCRETVTGLVMGSDLAQCLQVNNLLPILLNSNTSVIPNVNDYLVDLCAAEACDPEVITNATRSVQSSCATDLARFGISNGTVDTVMGAYDTARKVACLSTNDTQLTETNMMDNSTMANSTADTNSTLCPTALLYQAEQYLGVNFTNTYIDSLLLGANATAYRQLLAVPQNSTIVEGLVCNDCIAASLQVILSDYPQLEDLTFNISSETVEQYVNVTLSQNGTGPANSTWNISSVYQGVCDVQVNSSSPLPASINQTAYNTTEPMMNMTSTAVPSIATASASTVTGPLASTTAAAVSAASAATVVATGTSAGGVVNSVVAPVSSAAVAPGSVVSGAVQSVTNVAAPTKRFVKWD